MNKTLPEGDPVLALTDKEFILLNSFSHAFPSRVTEEVTHILASFIYFCREDPPKPDFTGQVIWWSSHTKSLQVAECLEHTSEGFCSTDLGPVHESLVNKFVNGSEFHIRARR